MHAKPVAILFCATALAAANFGYADSTNAPAVPAAPPAVSAQPPPPVAAPPSIAPNPDRVIYAPDLPTVSELTRVAAVQGVAIDSIQQTNAEILVVYKYTNGQTQTIAYERLPAAGMVADQRVAVAPVQTPTPAPTVVYVQRPDYYYTDGYYPSYWYPPVSLSFGYSYGEGYGYGHDYGHGFGDQDDDEHDQLFGYGHDYGHGFGRGGGFGHGPGHGGGFGHEHGGRR